MTVYQPTKERVDSKAKLKKQYTTLFGFMRDRIC